MRGKKNGKHPYPQVIAPLPRKFQNVMSHWQKTHCHITLCKQTAVKIRAFSIS